MSKLSAALFALHKIIGKKSVIFLLGCALIAPALGFLSACNDGGEESYEYALSRSVINLTFSSMDTEYPLPEIITKDPNPTVEWSDPVSSISDPVAFLLQGRDKPSYSVNPIDVMHRVATASAVFTATITGSKGGVVTREFKVNVTDKGSDFFDVLYSTQRGNINYAAQGIGGSRVFGLRDIAAPAQVTPANYTEVDFTLSSDTFELRWDYKKSDVEIAVWAEDISGNKSSDVIQVIYNPTENARKVTVNFKSAGEAKVVAESKTAYRDDLKARYEYVYKIEDAVNCYDYSDIKLLEKLARYDYITGGVPGVERKTEGGYTEISGAALSGYIVPGSNPDGLLSDHFKTTATPYSFLRPQKVAGEDEYKYAPGAFFNEFERWAPAYKYKDIVIRSASKDPKQATRKMYTWAESTWFFGSVHGNGYELDASPYTRGVAGLSGNYAHKGVYRNIHSMRGIETDKYESGYSLGFEGKPFFLGYGWGDIYAFYALSNNSMVDNITLTGENIPQGNEAIKLYQYHKIGVLGTSTMAGKDRPFSQGNAHDGGVPINGLYIEGIKVTNSILEKGLTLFGASFAPDASNPCVIDTCVLRYAGFTGILGNGYGGGINGEDTENGGEVAQNNTLAGGGDKKFGNYITARSNIYHDISVSPLLTMPSMSGTRMSIEGNENYFYTWLKSNEIQFPEMKDPSSENPARVLGSSINAQVPKVMKVMFDGGRVNSLIGGNNEKVKYYQGDSGVYRVNIPAISVVSGDSDQITNSISFENSSLDGATREDFARISHAIEIAGVMPELDQGFHITMLYSPDNAPASVNLVRVEDINSQNINMRISGMIPAGTKTPTVVPRTFVNLPAESVKLFSALSVPLTGHKIRYNGQEVAAEEKTGGYFTVSLQALNGLGINKFGSYKFDLVNEADGERVSSFSVIFQGSNDKAAPSVTPGSMGYVASGANQTKYMEYALNLEDGNTLTGVSLTSGAALEYAFENGVLRIEGTQLKNGENVIAAATRDFTLILRQQAVKLTVAADSYAVDLAGQSDYIIGLLPDINTSGLKISVNGVEISSQNYTLTESVDGSLHNIRIPYGTVTGVTGVIAVAGNSYPVVITNGNGLLLETELAITATRTDVEIIYINGDYVNKAAGHRDYSDITVELSGYQGQTIIGIAAAAAGADAPVAPDIRFSEYAGFSIAKDSASNKWLLTIPAAAVAESAAFRAGGEYRIYVFTGVSAAGAASGQTVYVYDANHENAAVFYSGEYEYIKGGGGLTLGLKKEIHYYDSDVFGEKLFGGSTFPEDGNVLTIYDSKGNKVAQFSREALIDGTDVKFNFIDGESGIAELLNDMFLRYMHYSVNELFDLVTDLLRQLFPEATEEDLADLYELVLENEITTTQELANYVSDLLSMLTEDGNPDIPLTGKYASAITISDGVLSGLDAGEYTVELRNNYNISYATLTLSGL